MSVATLHTKRPPVTEFPLSRFHIYRAGGLWDDDKIVRADDRKTPRYYSKGTRLAANWEFALHVGGSQHGLPVCHVRSPYLGPPLMGTDPSPITITFGSEPQTTVQVYRGKNACDGAYAFKGFDNQDYRWKPSSRVWPNKLECLNSHNQVVATYRITFFAMSKDGELCIYQPVQYMTDLLVATCLAMRTPDH